MPKNITAGITMPQTASDEIKRKLKDVRDILECGYSAANDGIFAEEEDYLKWLQTEKQPQQAVNRFIAEVGSKSGIGGAVGDLTKYMAHYDGLSAALRFTQEKPLTQDDLNAISYHLNALMGTKDEPGLAQAIYQFNKATEEKYSGRPEIRTMLSMVKRVEKVANNIENIAITDYNARVEDRQRELGVITGAIEDFQTTNAQLDERIMQNCAGMSPAEFQDAIETLTNKNAKLDTAIAATEKQISELQESQKALQETLSAQTRQLEQTGRDLQAEQRNVQYFTNRKNALQANLANQQIAVKAESQLEAENREILRNDVLKAEIWMNRFKASIPEANLLAFIKANDDLTNCRSLSANTEQLRSISQENARQLTAKTSRDRLFEKTGQYDPIIGDYCRFVSSFVDLYDSLHPAPTGFLSRFSSHKTGDQIIAQILAKHEKQDPIKDMGKDFAPYLSEMQHELEQRMTKLGGKDAVKYQSVFAKHQELSKQYDEMVSAEQKKQSAFAADRSGKEKAQRELQSSEKEIRQLGKDIENAQHAEQQHSAAMKTGEKDIADTKTAIQKAQAEMAVLEAQLAKQKATKEACEKNIQTLESLHHMANRVQLKRNMCRDLINDFRRDAKPLESLAEPLVSARDDRINARLDSFLLRVADYQGSHKNTPEYQAMVDALVEARNDGAAHFKENIAKIEKAAINYVHKKGSRTFSIHKRRQARLNMAHELQAWCEGFEGMLDTKPAEYSRSLQETEQKIRTADIDQILPDVFKAPARPVQAKPAANAKANVNAQQQNKPKQFGL